MPDQNAKEAPSGEKGRGEFAGLIGNLAKRVAVAGIVASALALSRGFLPPTINQREADPDCDMDFIPNRGRAASVGAALCNCLGFGSTNSAIVLGAA